MITFEQYLEMQWGTSEEPEEPAAPPAAPAGLPTPDYRAAYGAGLPQYAPTGDEEITPDSPEYQAMYQQMLQTWPALAKAGPGIQKDYVTKAVQGQRWQKWQQQQGATPDQQYGPAQYDFQNRGHGIGTELTNWWGNEKGAKAGLVVGNDVHGRGQAVVNFDKNKMTTDQKQQVWQYKFQQAMDYIKKGAEGFLSNPNNFYGAGSPYYAKAHAAIDKQVGALIVKKLMTHLDSMKVKYRKGGQASSNTFNTLTSKGLARSPGVYDEAAADREAQIRASYSRCIEGLIKSIQAAYQWYHDKGDADIYQLRQAIGKEAVKYLKNLKPKV
jgi:hypothetical protein